MDSLKPVSKVHFFLLAVAFTMVSCIERQEFPLEPVIEFKNFNITQVNGTETGGIELSFTDGDGDIGLEAADTLFPFQQSGDYYYNFLMNIYKKQGNDTLLLPYNLRIPPINPDDYEQNLKGEMYIEIQLDIVRTILPDNKFQFEAFIYDRQLHKSNIIVSPVILL